MAIWLPALTANSFLIQRSQLVFRYVQLLNCWTRFVYTLTFDELGTYHLPYFFLSPLIG